MTTATIAGLATLVLGGVGFSQLNDTTPGQAQDTKRKVTGRFDNATLAEALKWLSARGVSFVADSSQLAGDERVTLNIAGQPVSDVMEAVADAFHGKWTKHGNVYTFTRDHGRFSTDMPGFHLGPRSFESLKDLEHFAPQLELELREGLKGLEGLEKFGMSPEDVEELEGLGSKIADELRLELKGHDMSPQDRAKLERLGPKLELELKEKLKGLKNLELHPEHLKDLEELGAKIEEEIRLKMKGPEDLKDLEVPAPPATRFGGSDIPKLIGSLSAQQKARHERQGYLTPSDLTPEQRRFAGQLPDMGAWTLTYVIDGKKLTLKGK
ncbi:MAG: hypothetical protein ACR2HJ_03220 [Fimbriimonadales bacterium]